MPKTSKNAEMYPAWPILPRSLLAHSGGKLDRISSIHHRHSSVPLSLSGTDMREGDAPCADGSLT